MKHTTMYDVGHKMSEEMAMQPKKNEKHYQDLSFTDKELPCLKGAKSGDKLSLLSLCEVDSVEDKKGEPSRYRLKVLKMGEESEMKMHKALEKATKEEEE